jgi:NAD dependent epimerase/dehydratase family enzyme
MYGEAAVALLGGQFIYPQRLLDLGFEFRYPGIVAAVKAVLEKR